MSESNKCVQVRDILTEEQIGHIVTRSVGSGQVLETAIRPATDGLAGFVGDHYRLTLEVAVDGRRHNLPLFVKAVPRHNDAKISFIRENGFFKREMTVFKIIEDLETGPTPCVAKALFYSDSVLVMPDLAAQGYSIRNQLETFDSPHLLVALNSVARFHAAFANYETKKSLANNRPYSVLEDHGDIIVETTFKDTAWIHTAAKLTANMIERLSKYKSIPNLKDSVLNQFLSGCKDLKASDSLNVIIHKDLWVNNIMFKYENDVPINAIILDFQCVRYGPPAFDVLMLIYLTTSRSFRQENEDLILNNYFETFIEYLDMDTKLRLKTLGYDFEDFQKWVCKARRFAMVAVLSIFPFVLMDSSTASETFDDPDTYGRLMYEDRTEVVLAHAMRCREYGSRQVELAEEFVERFLL
ncbi:uncharacterized protein LOC125230235 [Leguminivora glycinivorella]|uniref:uncharacterized protein LOC125230235 n=1 Tax=Leguminivora glycinivorella TaxID=1035111 RepID=UPI00200F884E|nr:uncharacterized protein LOC125230235 [Leguminivora glycinivorella]